MKIGNSENMIDAPFWWMIIFIVMLPLTFVAFFLGVVVDILGTYFDWGRKFISRRMEETERTGVRGL